MPPPVKAMSASATRPRSRHRLSVDVSTCPLGLSRDTVTRPLTVTAIQPSMGLPPNSVSDGENLTRENFSPKLEAPDFSTCSASFTPLCSQDRATMGSPSTRLPTGLSQLLARWSAMLQHLICPLASADRSREPDWSHSRQVMASLCSELMECTSQGCSVSRMWIRRVRSWSSFRRSVVKAMRLRQDHAQARGTDGQCVLLGHFSHSQT